MQEYRQGNGWQEPQAASAKAVADALKRGSEVAVFPNTPKHIEKAYARMGAVKTGKYRVCTNQDIEPRIINAGTTKNRAYMIVDQLSKDHPELARFYSIQFFDGTDWCSIT